MYGTTIIFFPQRTYNLGVFVLSLDDCYKTPRSSFFLVAYFALQYQCRFATFATLGNDKIEILTNADKIANARDNVLGNTIDSVMCDFV